MVAMPSDDDGNGLLPNEGPDWDTGFSDSLQRFQEGVRQWRRQEEVACSERAEGRNLHQRTVASADFAAEDCLKAHFPERADTESGEGDAPLQTLQAVARSQREQLHQVLELVREHAGQFEGNTELLEQLPTTGAAARRSSGSEVVEMLAQLLDVASRSLSKRRKEVAEPAPEAAPRKEEELERREGHEKPRDEVAPKNGRDRDDRDARDGRGAREGAASRDEGHARDRDGAAHSKEERRDGRDRGRGENGDRRAVADDRRGGRRGEDPKDARSGVPDRSRSRRGDAPARRVGNGASN
ncbi:unnamed protein product, partial [Polarella glacialis]